MHTCHTCAFSHSVSSHMHKACLYSHCTYTPRLSTDHIYIHVYPTHGHMPCTPLCTHVCNTMHTHRHPHHVHTHTLQGVVLHTHHGRMHTMLGEHSPCTLARCTHPPYTHSHTFLTPPLSHPASLTPTDTLGCHTHIHCLTPTHTSLHTRPH